MFLAIFEKNAQVDEPFRIKNWRFLNSQLLSLKRAGWFDSTCRRVKEIHVFALHCLHADHANLIFVISSLVSWRGHYVLVS